VSELPNAKVVGSRQPGLIVYLCGLGTSALVLYGAHRLAESGTYVMGWYVNGILPAGAILIGLLSGAGYAIGSYLLETKLSRAFVLGMLVTGFFDYWAAEYLAYQRLLEAHGASPDALSFFSYIQSITENMTFSTSGSSSPGSALGAAGYFFKLLELGGFMLGTMLPSAGLRSLPYCRRCQLYLKTARVGYLESAAPKEAVFDAPRKQRAALLGEAMQQVTGAALELVRPIPAASYEQALAIVSELNPKHLRKSAAQVELTLRKCPRCDAHHLRVTLSYIGVDKRPASRLVQAFDKTEIVAPS
jgi:hypothetical protein